MESHSCAVIYIYYNSISTTGICMMRNANNRFSLSPFRRSGFSVSLQDSRSPHFLPPMRIDLPHSPTSYRHISVVPYFNEREMLCPREYLYFAAFRLWSKNENGTWQRWPFYLFFFYTFFSISNQFSLRISNLRLPCTSCECFVEKWVSQERHIYNNSSSFLSYRVKA